MTSKRLLERLVWKQRTGDRWVAFLPEVEAAWKDIDERYKKRLENLFRIYGDRSLKLPPEKFKQEGRYATGLPNGDTTSVYAFKSFQERIYGASLHIEGHETFVGVEHERKKKDRANKETLTRVAKTIGSYL